MYLKKQTKITLQDGFVCKWRRKYASGVWGQLSPLTLSIK